MYIIFLAKNKSKMSTESSHLYTRSEYTINEISPGQFLQKVFDKHDQDHNGRINKFEFTSILRVLTQLTGAAFPTSNDIDDIFVNLDSDGDQTLSYEEYKILIKSFTPLIEEQGIKIKLKQAM